MKKNSKKKVLVCMSGGVDSSVTAALLLKQGYEVTGAYMKQWTDTKDLRGICNWKEDRRDAIRVAAHLGIPLITLDFEKEYKDFVVKYMFKEYKAGRTPNPDIMCNRFIKFGFWLEKTKELDFDYMATGHYAQVEAISNKQKVISYKLLEAKDKDKDQTYFLHQLSQEQLKHVLFPIGPYTKKQVRALAKKFKLPTAERAESMGICFIGEIPIKDFLQQKIKPKRGKILMNDGTVVGEHDGLSFYTIGQRHGFSQAGGRNPLYVVDKNIKKNELIVGFEDDPSLYKLKIEVGEVNWTSRSPSLKATADRDGQSLKFPLECAVRLRHRQELQKAKIMAVQSKIIIEFKKSQKAVTPGQFAVFYKGGECLGGGVIEN